MSPLAAISLAGVTFFVGLLIGYLFVKTGERTGNISFNSYDCATKALTVTTANAMNLYIDALDDTDGNAVQPDFPGPNAVQSPNVNGNVTLGPLIPENGADKVLICVWEITKVDTWPRDCSGSSSSSGSGHVLKKLPRKKTILP